MKRSQIILAALGAVLLVVVYYVLLFQPARDELAAVQEELVAEEAQQQQLAVEIARLRSVREEAPEVEAELAAAEAIVPRGAALPSALRQLQLAADESGLVLVSVSTSRPTPVDGPIDDLSAVAATMQVNGSYFQVVDFLRRVEDPAITPRGLDWANATVSRGDYPELQVSLTGTLYALIDVPVAPEAQPPPDDGEAADVEDPDAELDTENDS